MTIRSLTGCVKYQLMRMKGVLAFLPAMSIGGMLFGAILTSLIEHTPFTFKGAEMTALDAFSMIMMFVFMCCYSQDFVNTAAANGASRKTAILSQLISVAIISLLVTAECAVLSPLTAAMGGGQQFWSAEVYGGVSALLQSGMNIVLVYLRLYLLCFMFSLASGAAGIMFTSIVYRLPGWIAAVVIGLIAFGPNLGVLAVFGIEKVQWLYTGLFKLAGLFANGPTGNAAQGVAFFAVLTAAEIIISFLLVMRASAKPLPVKGE